jgi:hypothetical protein
MEDIANQRKSVVYVVNSLEMLIVQSQCAASISTRIVASVIVTAAACTTFVVVTVVHWS